MTGTELEDSSVNASVAAHVFHRKDVVLLMSEKAYDATPAEWDCSFTHSHGKTTNLLAFIAKKNILDRTYLHLHRWVDSLLEPQHTVLNGQCSRRIFPGTFEA
ncbi:MAG TPA: hypothetical protein VMJ35_03570 [Dongiaceae bacterium]|nr:hypothetical protein [Dongiaceae bacterium]